MRHTSKDGLRVARLMMVLSSLTPLFILWVIRGVPVLSDTWFILICVILIVVPNAILYGRILVAKKRHDTNQLTIGKAEDHRDHLLVYLFAMLLPLYAANLSTWREFSATLAAFVFIVFLFWHLNMHYMNILFAVFGYRVFTITSPEGVNELSGREPFVLITQRCYLNSNDKIRALRLSNTVYFEPKEKN